jgi:hypothetical protein
MTVVPFLRKASGTPTFHRYIECIDETFLARQGRLTVADFDGLRARLPALIAYLARGGDPKGVFPMNDLSLPTLAWLTMSLSTACHTLLLEIHEDCDAGGGFRSHRFSHDPRQATRLDDALSVLIEVLRARPDFLKQQATVQS